MHILKVIHGYPPLYNAGSEVYSQSLCNEISRTHSVSIFTREENPYKPCFSIRLSQEKENLNIYYFNNPQSKDGYRHIAMDNEFGKLLDIIKPDIAHVGHLNHLSTGIIDVLHNRNIPIIFTLHDFWLMCPRGQFLTRSIGKENNFELCEKQINSKCATDCYRVYWSGIEEKGNDELKYWEDWINTRMKVTTSIASKVSFFIAPSNYLMNRFIKDFNISKDKISYIDYGFPLEYLSPVYKKENTEPYTFGYIGTHIPAKGINLLIDAFLEIDQPCKLLIWGHKDSQSSNALKKMAESSKNLIEFRGEYVNQNLAKEVFSQVDSIVVPSIWGENSPLVIHEAQACKITVITADFGGMKEYVRDKYNGLLFKHRDKTSLVEVMKFAINNPILMRDFGNKGYLYSSDGNVPDIESHAKDIMKIYSRFCS